MKNENGYEKSGIGEKTAGSSEYCERLHVQVTIKKDGETIGIGHNRKSCSAGVLGIPRVPCNNDIDTAIVCSKNALDAAIDDVLDPGRLDGADVYIAAYDHTTGADIVSVDKLRAMLVDACQKQLERLWECGAKFLYLSTGWAYYAKFAIDDLINTKPAKTKKVPNPVDDNVRIIDPMEHARSVADRSPCEEYKIGVVIKKGAIVNGVGYNKCINCSLSKCPCDCGVCYAAAGTGDAIADAISDINDIRTADGATVYIAAYQSVNGFDVMYPLEGGALEAMVANTYPLSLYKLQKIGIKYIVFDGLDDPVGISAVIDQIGGDVMARINEMEQVTDKMQQMVDNVTSDKIDLYEMAEGLAKKSPCRLYKMGCVIANGWEIIDNKIYGSDGVLGSGYNRCINCLGSSCPCYRSCPVESGTDPEDYMCDAIVEAIGNIGDRAAVQGAVAVIYIARHNDGMSGVQSVECASVEEHLLDSYYKHLCRMREMGVESLFLAGSRLINLDDFLCEYASRANAWESISGSGLMDRVNAKMHQAVAGNAVNPDLIVKSNYLDNFEKMLSEYKVTMRTDNGNLRDPKAVIFDIVMTVGKALRGAMPWGL